MGSDPMALVNMLPYDSPNIIIPIKAYKVLHLLKLESENKS